MLPEPNQPDEDVNKPRDSSSRSAVLRRRSRSKRSGNYGKVLVIIMILLVLAFIGTSAFLSFSGHLHPVLNNFGGLTLWILYGAVVPVIVLCLFQLYNGKFAIKHVFASASVIAASAFGITITFRILTDILDCPWTVFDVTGLFVAAYAAWVCLFSKHAYRFLMLQGDKRR